MKFAYCLAGDPLLKTVKVGATVTAGQVCMRDTNKYGCAIPATTSGSADSFGVALSTGTYATSAEGTCQVVMSPLQVLRGQAIGSTTDGTALTVLENTSASTTVFSDADVGTVDLTGGYLYILTGANAGLRRVVTSRNSAQDVTVTVAWPSSVAVGDKGIWMPFSIGSQVVVPTSNIQNLDATSVTNGLDASVVDVELELPINSSAPVVWVDIVLQNHVLNQSD